ncbi:DUF2249 domain-containing protein [Catenulispora rubra]|uniref:DUF2249 domain-containing protein n=1 Tax=Catenulispora rubra TaxID=280293 RepID=UPI0018923330|nr:DUF2249 domain-containing protein [Catenulispora rubra]
MSSPARVYIQATQTDPNIHAQTAIGLIHERLRSRLAELTEASVHVTRGEPVQAGPELCARRVRLHLTATDEALYAPAAGAAQTRLLVRALRTAAAAFDPLITALSTASDADRAAGAARSLDTVLAVHFAVEQSVLLPALADLPGADLAALAADLGTLLEGGRLESSAVIDVREIPHGQRHPRIFARFARLAPGQDFVLVNNHDPKPLRREFDATHPGAFTWDYLESGPEQWRIRVGRAPVDA